MARILAVHADPAVRARLRDALAGDELAEVASGEEALVRAADAAPDLVLIGDPLPGIDAGETTRRLKASFAHTIVPVLVCATDDTRASRLAAVVAGADGVLAPPIDGDELRACVANLLALRARGVELEDRNAELVELDRFRDETLAMLVHDLKSPLAVIQASVEFAASQADLTAETREALDDVRQASGRIARLVATILETAHAEAGQLALRPDRVALGPLVDAALGPRRALLERRKIAIDADVAGVAVTADREVLARVVDNLIENLTRATPAKGRLRLWAQAAGGEVELRVGSTAPAIPPASRPLVFEKFTQVWDAARGSVGLGLYFCRLAVEAHGGRIWIEETDALPVVFAVALPA